MNVISFIIEARDKASGAFENIKKSFADLKTSWSNAMAGLKEGSASGLLSFVGKIGGAVVAAGTALKGLAAAAKFAGESIQTFAELETLTIRLSRVTGGMKEARDAMRALTEGRGNVTDLFGDQDVMQAAISLKRLSAGVLGSADDIKTLAGAAYDTGSTLSDVAQSVGALTGMITEGLPGWERMARSMAKSGIVSFETIKAMGDMKEAGKSAGEIIEFMWKALEKDHSGAINQARDSIDGLAKKAEESQHAMKRAIGELFEPFGRLWDHIKIGFSETMAFIVNGLTSIPKNIGTFLGAMAGGSSAREAANMVLDNYDAEKNPKTGKKADIAAEINAKAGQTDADKEKAKKATEELKKKRDEEQKKLNDATSTPQQKMTELWNERKDINLQFQNSITDGTDAKLKAETRILEIDQEILKLKKEISDEEKKAESAVAKQELEIAAREQKAKRERLVEQSQSKYHEKFDKATPEQQLAMTEANIKTWKKRLAEAGSEEEKAAATKGLVGQLKEREKIQKEIEEKGKKRSEKEEALAVRDRELRESAMTTDQKKAESQKRTAEIEKQLKTEKDPDKRIELREKLMTEAETRNKLTPSRHGMSIGDVFEKGYGQAGKRDPAHEQVEKLKDIKEILKKIADFGPGGMTK